MLLAITRAVSPTIDRCELTHLAREPIDLACAIQEHHAYEQTLRELGIEVLSLPAEPQYPDAMFVEDPMIVFDEVAIVTRPGVESRRGEADTLIPLVAEYRPLRYIEAPATLDGGDVLRAGRSLYVGLSLRTNADGIRQLAAAVEPFGYRVYPAAVTGCLHLKSGASYVGDNTVLIHRPWVDAAAFRGLKLVDVPPGEEAAANVLLIGNTVLVAKRFPATAALLRELGRDVIAVDIAELMKAESGLTCSSLIFERVPRL